MSRGSFRFGDVRFSLIRRSELGAVVTEWARQQQSRTITLTGAHGVAESRSSDEVRHAHDDADLVLCDGTPPWIGAVILGYRASVDRIPGIVAMRAIAAAAVRLRLAQAFIGGPPGLAERTRAGLGRAIDAPIGGLAWSPPFVATIDQDFVELASQQLDAVRTPAVVWIGLSTPKQELLAQQLKRRRPTGFLFVAVGAAFDIYAGDMPTPPLVFSRTGTAWLYRLAREPRRLAGRYTRAFPVVLWSLARACRDRLRR